MSRRPVAVAVAVKVNAHDNVNGAWLIRRLSGGTSAEGS